ncbi:MAG TPA: flavodoxin family protein [Gemmatimonadaceae bacterium]|nr:flavodoxin family protein [Gemmatimonadaceae bacterium]
MVTPLHFISRNSAGDTLTRIKAVFLLGTLKPKRGEFSHTKVLAEIVAEELEEHNVQSEIVRLADYVIKPGTKNNMGKSDEWPRILQKVLAAEIIVFATPIWWGNHSSLTQRAIERLDELHEELRETGKSRLTNKVGGIVITGEEDGEQHITGSISNFLISIGVTMPPMCAVSYLGDYSRASKESLRKRLRGDKATASAAKKMASNLAFFAGLLRENGIPREG